jgi:hypothetical protein
MPAAVEEVVTTGAEGIGTSKPHESFIATIHCTFALFPPLPGMIWIFWDLVHVAARLGPLSCCPNRAWAFFFLVSPPQRAQIAPTTKHISTHNKLCKSRTDPEFSLSSCCRGRREGKSSNGTVTLRRSSVQVSTAANPDASFQASEAAQATFQATNPDGGRYRKDEILDVARNLGDSVNSRPIAQLFMDGWQPGTGQVNGNASHSWGKNNEQTRDLDACWNSSGDTRPISLQEMSPDEREVRAETTSGTRPKARTLTGYDADVPDRR